jgi:hypothetical protein
MAAAIKLADLKKPMTVLATTMAGCCLKPYLARKISAYNMLGV